MKLKPWYDVIKPRADLREGKPLDASEFAVHLDKIRRKEEGVSQDYIDPKRFMERTFLTQNLLSLASEVVRRLSGTLVETNAVFSTMTQFGGGKTHALALLYHLMRHGKKANDWLGVSRIIEKAKVNSVPEACAVAVFVGTEFDSVNGRGGNDGTPLRKTPWGEIAFQLGGKEAFEIVRQHDEQFIEPKGDVINQMLPQNKPCLILMDEVLSYFSTYRQSGYGTKMYNFLQSLSETCRGRSGAVLIVSAPKSSFDYTYTADDHNDLQRIEHLMQRLSKPIMLASDSETSEIIRRRLFECNELPLGADGRVSLSKEAHDTCKAYAEWMLDNRGHLPELINLDKAREELLTTYPFHPMVLSVFERKWASLPRFQRTRGILRLLALWVSDVYREGYRRVHKDPLIMLGTAPLENSEFRSAVFEQLGEPKLETAVTTDIIGSANAHAVRLDEEALESIRDFRLHRKTATAIFFESNGGMVGEKAHYATLPEIRLAVGDPDLDIGNVETATEALLEACYYLTADGNRYKFSILENLNKRFSDRKATLQSQDVDEAVKKAIVEIFKKKDQAEVVFFPIQSSDVSDRPVITFAIGGLQQTMIEKDETVAQIEKSIREYGASSRQYKNAIIWIVADSAASMQDDARKMLAWEAVRDEAGNLDEDQKRQVQQNIEKAKRNLKEAAWRAYRYVYVLDKKNELERIDLGLVNSSSSETALSNAINSLRSKGIIEQEVGASFLARHWPKAFEEWSTKSVRDAIYSSPLFPRVLNSESVKSTITKGVAEGHFGYVEKDADGSVQSLKFKQDLGQNGAEISDEVFIIPKAKVSEYLQQEPIIPPIDNLGSTTQDDTVMQPVQQQQPKSPAVIQGDLFTELEWNGEIPYQKWMNFYTRVVSKFVTSQEVKLDVGLRIHSERGLSQQSVEDVRTALLELGLEGKVETKKE